MSLLGVDVGTTGCKAVAFDIRGKVLGAGYQEYDSATRSSHRAELDPLRTFESIKQVIRIAVAETASDPVSALAVSSFGEAVVPISASGEVLGPSLLATDDRGEEFVAALERRIGQRQVHDINGNTWGNQYGVTKLMWLKQYASDLYEKTAAFLLWSGFVAFMLGAEPTVDSTLANRTMLFDLAEGNWSQALIDAAGLDRAKLPRVVATGSQIGIVSPKLAGELGLPHNVAIVIGAHDQCANAVGCGAVKPGDAMLGMGTYFVIAPMFEASNRSGRMFDLGLNIEHAAVPGLYVSFIYNMTGAVVRWYRDTFASADHLQLAGTSEDIYDRLFAELPQGVSPVTVIPHFSAMGPPDYIDDASGAFAGLSLSTSRGDILKGILQGAAFSLRSCSDSLPEAGLPIRQFRVVGGGSRADRWVQLNADIFGRPVVRPAVTEAGALGSAILAAVGTGVFRDVHSAVGEMIGLERVFEPSDTRRAAYDLAYKEYQVMWERLSGFLRK